MSDHFGTLFIKGINNFDSRSKKNSKSRQQFKCSEIVHWNKTLPPKSKKENLRNAVKTVTFDYPDGGNHFSYFLLQFLGTWSTETKITELVNQDPGLFLPVIFLQNWIIKFFKRNLKLVLYFAHPNLISSDETPFDWSQLRVIHILIKFYCTSKTYLGYTEPKLHIFNWNVLRNWSLKS